MGLKLITDVTEEPVTLAEVKLHLRIDQTADDTILTSYIVAARKHAEAFLNHQLCSATWDLYMDSFHDCNYVEDDIIKVPLPPLQSVTSITYVDTGGASVVLDASKYITDINERPGRIAEAWGEVWPATREIINAVIVRFVAGFGAATAVPEDIKVAIKELVGHIYEHPEASYVGGEVRSVPMSWESLLGSYRWWPI